MAKRTSQLITETQNDFARLQNELESAKATRDRYQKDLDNARRRLSRRENSEYPDKLAENLVSALQKGNVLETILVTSIDAAIQENPEFSREPYVAALYKVAKMKEIYKLIKIGTGWGTHLATQIVYEEGAGDLNDWGQAVIDYREFELKSRGLDDEDSGEKASSWFATNVLDTALHDKTITGRLNYTPAEAPFWRILNNGESPLVSDRPGGYSVANNKPTDFVGDAERAINNQFYTAMQKEYEKVRKEEDEIDKLIKEYEERRDSYTEDVKNLRTEMKLNEQIIKGFKEKAEYIDKDILAKAVRSLDQGRRTETINIAKAGTGMELLITIRRSQGVIEY